MLNETEAGIMIVGGLIILALAMTGIVLLLFSALGKFVLWFDRRREKEEMKVWKVIETASNLPLAQAVSVLAGVGIKYDASLNCHVGRRFNLPRGFWAGETSHKRVSVKARTLLTLAKWALFEIQTDSDVLRELVMVLAQQLKRRPGLAVIMFCELSSLAKSELFPELMTVMRDIDCCQLWRRR